MYYKSSSYKVFYYINTAFLVLLGIVCLLPLLHIVAVSLSSAEAATAKIVNFTPVNFNLETYRLTFGDPNFLRSVWISVQRTVLGTALSMLVTFLAAYPLSKTKQVVKGRSIYAWYFVFTMVFGGGLIPTYLVVVNLGLANSLAALVFPPMVNVFNLILMLNFFRSIPNDFDEAALIDGAGYLRILFLIYLPLSLPSIATLSLFMMVFHWNSWFDGMIYISNYRNYPFATFLQNVVVQADFTRLDLEWEDVKNLSERALSATQIVLGTLPILLVYPFLQKYFVKGLTLGGVKG